MSEYEVEQIMSLIPIFVISVMVGLASFFTQKEVDTRGAIKEFLKQMVLSVALCLIVYSILTATDLPYLARIGISCAVAFFGMDKAISIVQNLISLRNNRGNINSQESKKGNDK